MSVYSNGIADTYKAACEKVQQDLKINSGTIFTSFYSIAINAFQWSNLPSGVLRFLPEEYLMFAARLGFFKYNGEFKMLPVFPSGTLLENGEYTDYIATAKNGNQYHIKRDELCICYSNSLVLPTIGIINEWAERCGYALSAVDNMLAKSIMPDVIGTRDKDALASLTKFWDKDNKLVPFVVSQNEALFNNETVRVPLFDSREKDVLAQWEIFEKYRNFFFNLFGVFSVGIQKNERLTKRESEGNSDNVRYSLYDDMYYNRLSFAKDVYERFGYKLEVKKNREIAVTQEEIEKEREIIYNKK